MEKRRHIALPDTRRRGQLDNTLKEKLSHTTAALKFLSPLDGVPFSLSLVWYFSSWYASFYSILPQSWIHTSGGLSLLPMLLLLGDTVLSRCTVCGVTCCVCLWAVCDVIQQNCVLCSVCVLCVFCWDAEVSVLRYMSVF